MVIKVINALLVLAAVFMGLKQGYAMFSGKPEMVDMFSKWNFGKIGLTIFGVVTMFSAILILLPSTFVWGNVLMAAGIGMIICFHLSDGNWKGVWIELPFLLLNLLIIWLKYPFKK